GRNCRYDVVSRQQGRNVQAKPQWTFCHWIFLQKAAIQIVNNYASYWKIVPQLYPGTRRNRENFQSVSVLPLPGIYTQNVEIDQRSVNVSLRKPVITFLLFGINRDLVNLHVIGTNGTPMPAEEIPLRTIVRFFYDEY